MNFRVLALVVLLGMSISGFADSVLYIQTFDGTGNLYASQNDTTGGFGLFAQVYDNFNINAGGPYAIHDVQWTGGYFNPPQQGPITGWTIAFYADAAGQPGALLNSTHVNGTGGETFLGIFNGFPIYTYDVPIDWDPNSGTEYWTSVVPDLGYPPQWGWASAGGGSQVFDGGDGISYQDFFGVRTQLNVDMAFTLIGELKETGVPEPGTIVMLGTGVLGLAGALRRKLF